MTQGKWMMPAWMEMYRTFIGNTGGNTVEELMNGNESPDVNLPLSTLQACVKSQVGLLIRMHEANILAEELSQSRRERR